MDNTVRAFMKHHQLINEHSTVLIAVSGGPDSMALLHFFYKVRAEWDLRLIAISVDHQLRGQESLDDLDYVRQMCQQWGIEFVGTSLDVPAYKQEKQIGTQVAARERRYQFFAEQMTTYQADYLAFGHHADDQAETMVMGLVHSASVKSLAGIPLERDFASGKIIRPFLCVTKEQIEHYCREHGITPRRDPSNIESTYTRNDYRHNILPLLKEKNHNWHQTIRHLSTSLQEDEAFLQREAEKMIQDVVIFGQPETSVHFNIHTFKAYPRSLQRRALHLILGYLYNGNKIDITYVHEEAFLTMLLSDHGHVQVDFPHQLRLTRSYGTMSFDFQRDQPESYHMIMALPGETALPGGITFAADVTNDPQRDRETVYVCHKGAVALPLHIRTREPGDRLRWTGLHGSKKVKDIFIDAKIPVNERNTWPVITDNNNVVLWLPGLKKGLPPVQTENGTYIQISYTKRDT
ncbi:tRNA lysidine(34) synthetase TilS [Lentibacillus salinarum]|uniref:tRNA(Ile)-lysidine synthase n=1 Tax=Lentibacillus salinarum TaxID=446820 RepID=A0ABW3ZXH0_9BACI